jgi:FG-GAP repeat
LATLVISATMVLGSGSAAPVSQGPTVTVLAHLTAPGTSLNDAFGLGIALSRDTVLVGGPDEDGPGRAAAIQPQTPPIGTRLAVIKPGGFVSSVAMSGSTIVVGADELDGAGRVLVFTRSGSGWTRTAELSGTDTKAGAEFGSSVAISGTTIAVTAGEAFRTYAFSNAGSGWFQLAEFASPEGLVASVPVAISGNTMIVADGWGKGTVYSLVGGRWRKSAILAGPGRVLYGPSNVGLSGNAAIVSDQTWRTRPGSFAPLDTAAWLFSRTATGWRRTAEIGPFYDATDDNDVALAGNNVFLSSFGSGGPGPGGPGTVRAFSTTTTGWQQTGEFKHHADFGTSLAIAGTVGLVGDRSAGSIAAYVFLKTTTGWRAKAVLRFPKGFSTAVLSGSYALVVGSNEVHVFEA